MKYQADTIVYDANKIAEYQADSRFDYNSQLDLQNYSWFDFIAKWFNRLLNNIFSGAFEENVTTPVMVFLFIVAVASSLYFLYKKRPELFMRTKKTAHLPYNIEEENIHKIDFNKEISNALEKRDYRLATRLIYLQTLRLLSDKELIDWQIHKTPTEYYYEIKNMEMKPLFLKLTNHFLQVRYGNYIASHELYETMLELQTGLKKIMEGGANER